MCNIFMFIRKYDKSQFDWTNAFGTQAVTNTLIYGGADKDTINVYDREINSKSGAVGSGYITKSGSTRYIAAFYVSPKSMCYIYIWDNQSMMISALKTINVTETA